MPKRPSLRENNPFSDESEEDAFELIIPTKDRVKSTKNLKVVQARPTRQMSVLLYDDQIEWLEALVKVIKKHGWRNMSKANILRAIIDSIMESNIDLSHVNSEKNIKEILQAKKL